MTQTRRTASDARERAARILRDTYDGENWPASLSASSDAAGPHAESDASLMAELVLGVTRHRITCEHLASQYHRGRWEGLRPSIRTVLSLGVYQLCWLDRVPDHAAVDQAVRLAGKYGRGTADMVNAVLRKIAAVRGPVVERPAEPDARRYLALNESRGRLFSEDVFPDPARRPLEWLVTATGHPMYLVERWHRRFKPALARQICEAGRGRRPLVLRANRLRTTPDELVERLKARGLAAECFTEAQAVILRGDVSADAVPEIAEGLCQPQDSTAQMVLATAGLAAGQVVLDLCAGRGTKATQAAELTGDGGLVIATDVDNSKLAAVSQSAARLGLSGVRTVAMAELPAALASGSLTGGRPLDAILVDAPCSNTGVLGRRPEARHRATHKNLQSLVAIQREVLSLAASLAGPATRIIYSTCSIEREENEDQAAWFCERFPRWHAEETRLTLPGPDWDGGFVAVMEQDDNIEGN
jgi:16S rRNA (cytosine967-C5)-methyltransferase